MDILSEARQVLAIEIAALEKLTSSLGESFVAAVDALSACKGKVVVSGIGKSGLVGRKIASTLASTGTPAVFLHPAEGLHGDLGVVVPGDLALLISHSGETDEILAIIPSLKKRGIQILAICGAARSSLAQVADVTVAVEIEREACPHNLAPTASTTATLALGDALAVVLLKQRGFDVAAFAQLHPGGTIGKRLLLTVEDVMHAGSANPLIRQTQSMREAVIEISSKGLGAVTIVDDAGRLVGILTDGDLRRCLQTGTTNFLDLPVAQLMSADPTTIRTGRLAAEAVHLMEDRPSQIAVLPVVDAQHHPVGLIRIHDLVRAGVA